LTPFVAAMAVERSDFEIALEEGTIRCAAKVGGRSLVGRGAFVDERVACRWRVPKNASGKRLAGSVAVTFQGVYRQARILGSSEVKRLGAHALRVRPALQQRAMPGRI
jgi:hypothetical protein